MDTSIFGSLLRYSPRADRSPEENFFTEAFVSVLRRSHSHLLAIFRDLSGDRRAISVEIDTQFSFQSPDRERGRDQPDIVMRSDTNHLLLIESKLSAIEGANQLDRYWTILRRRDRPGTLAFITKAPEPQRTFNDANGLHFVQRRWNDIYQLLRRIETNIDSDSVLVNELLEFMEELHMAADLKLNDLMSAVTGARAESKFRDMLLEAWTQGGLQPEMEGRTVGIWTSKGVVAGDIGSWTYATRQTKVRLAFGMHFNTADPGPLKIRAVNDQLPVAYVALYHDGDFSEALVSAHQEFGLGHRGWVFGPEVSLEPQWIAMKQINLDKANLADFSPYLTDQLVTAFKELRGAPFIVGLDRPAHSPKSE